MGPGPSTATFPLTQAAFQGASLPHGWSSSMCFLQMQLGHTACSPWLSTHTEFMVRG